MQYIDGIYYLSIIFSRSLSFLMLSNSLPMQESFPLEHSAKLIGDSLEEPLNSGGIAHKCGGHLHAAWRNVADRRLYIVRNPLDKIWRVLIL